MNGNELAAAISAIRDALVGVPQYDGEFLVDESDEGWFRICDIDEESTRPMSEEEMREMYPVIWARKKLEEIINNMP